MELLAFILSVALAISISYNIWNYYGHRDTYYEDYIVEEYKERQKYKEEVKTVFLGVNPLYLTRSGINIMAGPFNTTEVIEENDKYVNGLLADGWKIKEQVLMENNGVGYWMILLHKFTIIEQAS